MSTFTIYDERLATVETDLDSAVFRDPKDVKSLLNRFISYERHAVFEEDAQQLLSEWARMYR